MRQPRTEAPRGTPMSAATVVYQGKPEDMSISAWRDHAPGFERDVYYQSLSTIARVVVVA